MIELGSFWAYYTNWFLWATVGGRAICIEPDENNLECGRRNLRLNDREANFIHAAIGKSHQNKIHFKRESDGNKQSIPCLDFNNILEAAQGAYIELIHIDIQGAELPFIESMNNEIIANKIRFIFISTHHHSISGSYHTHRDCLNKLIELGAIILKEHTIDESFSGDGLIVASFNEKDKEIILPEITKNKNELSYFYGN